MLCFVVRLCRQTKSALPHGNPMNGNEEIKREKKKNKFQSIWIFQIINIFIWNEKRENKKRHCRSCFISLYRNDKQMDFIRTSEIWILILEFSFELNACTFPIRKLWKTEWIVIVCPFCTCNYSLANRIAISNKHKFLYWLQLPGSAYVFAKPSKNRENLLIKKMKRKTNETLWAELGEQSSLMVITQKHNELVSETAFAAHLCCLSFLSVYF